MALTKKNYRERLIDKKIAEYLKIFGAISLEGPKWCGKTWTALNHANSEYLLDDKETLRLALVDEETVLKGDYPILIDEWNYIPSLWDSVRRKCDEDTNRGKFILTCSTSLEDKSNEEVNRKIHHSGTGRIVVLPMHPMSLYESGDSTGLVSINDMYENKEFENQLIGKISIEKIAYLVLRGGWPTNIGMEDPTIIPKEYIRSVLQKDINEREDRVRDSDKMHMLLNSLARNESTIVSNSTLIKDIEDNEDGDNLLKSRNTIPDYLGVLERLYIIYNQPSYTFNVRSKDRVGKSAKRHFIDPALACACLKLNEAKLLKDLKTFGFMFESMVERDLQIYMEYLNGRLYHYRNNTSGVEVDSILEFEDDSYAAVEIKLGYNQVEEAKASLMKFYEEAPVKPKFMCIIYGVGSSIYKDPETGIYILPITALKP